MLYSSTNTVMTSKRASHSQQRLTKPVFWALSDDRILSELRQSKAHFIDHYLSGQTNLSDETLPSCMDNNGFMPAPRPYGDFKTNDLVKQIQTLPHWQAQTVFKKIVKYLRKACSVSGVSISLMESSRQRVKYQSSFGFDLIPRSVSLDGHAILSKDYFLLLDASKDWRTRDNPFVTGPPKIRFYCGVPIIVNSLAVGVLAIFDPFPKNFFDSSLVQELQNKCTEISNLVSSPYDASTVDDLLQDELDELKRKIGRATSRGSEMLVYEKDGSGTSYAPNQKLHFQRLDSDGRLGRTNRLLWKKLANVASIRTASAILTKTIMINYKLDLVVILELRLIEKYAINSTYFPYLGKIAAETFRYRHMLVNMKDSKDIMMRVIGSYGGQQPMSYDRSMIERAASMLVGLYYKNTLGHTTYNSGIVMPFHKQAKSLMKCSLMQTSEPIGIEQKSGSYLIAMFSSDLNFDFGPHIVDACYTGAMMLRRIYIEA